jgi:hypothetical protein
VKKNTPNPTDEVYICMFCGCVGHLDEFCFSVQENGEEACGLC